MKYQICIPLHHSGGKFKNNRELRYCLRAIEKNFKDDFEISIVGKRVPDWIKGVKHLKCKQGLKTALRTAADTHPEGFFWLYDDCCILRPMGGKDMQVTPCSSRLVGDRKSRWAGHLSRIQKRLLKEGFKAWDYSRPHGPYWFDKSMVDESFEDWKGMAGKFPFESWILSKRNWPRRKGVVRQLYGKFGGAIDMNRWWFLNYSHSGTTWQLMDYLLTLFPEKSSFEKDNPLTLMAKEKKYLFTCHEGCDPRIWNWCSDGIRVFAHSNNAKLIELPKSNLKNPQWVFFDAVRESLKYGKDGSYAWIDSDVVVSYPATDIWNEYPDRLRLTYNKVKKDLVFYDQYDLPHSLDNLCTGVVKWSYEDALIITDWCDKNVHLFEKKWGDQELLIKCLYDTSLKHRYFHPKMQVTGTRPPQHTAFKHRGGASKVRWIPIFIDINKKSGLYPPSDVIQKSLTSL